MKNTITNIWRNPIVACWLNGWFKWGLERLYFFLILRFCWSPSIVTFPDDATDRWKRGIKRNSLDQGLSWFVLTKNIKLKTNNKTLMIFAAPSTAITVSLCQMGFLKVKQKGFREYGWIKQVHSVLACTLKVDSCCNITPHPFKIT